MKIGVCTSIESIDKVEAMGFDYIELSASAVAKMSKDEFNKALEKVEKSSIKCEAFNTLFPKDLKLVGTEADRDVM